MFRIISAGEHVEMTAIVGCIVANCLVEITVEVTLKKG